jgi:alanyl-tRNA synthetase
MTDRLYYDDSYLVRFTARVTERLSYEGAPAVILDRTAFYPTGGGQPCDMGTLSGIPVIDVIARESDAAVIHVLAEPLDAEQVEAEINWLRRFDHMQQHTGQHLLTAACVQVAEAKTIGFHLSLDSLTIDLDRPDLPDSALAEAETLANRVIQEDRAVTARLRDLDNQKGVRMRRLPKHLLTEGLRVVEIDGFDVTACGGTHVARTGAIGLLKIVKAEKHRGKTRLEFLCGGRALRDYQAKHRAIARLAADLDCRYSETPELVAKVRADLKAAQSALKAAREQLVEFEADRLLAGADRTRGWALIQAAYEERDAAELKLLASRLTVGPGVIALIGSAGDKCQMVFARSADLPHDMGGLLREIATSRGGRGGGQPNFAQGGGMSATLDALSAALSDAAARL